MSEDEARGLRAWGELLGWLAKREGTDSIEKLTPVAVDFYAELVAGAEFMRQNGQQRKDGDLTEGGRGPV